MTNKNLLKGHLTAIITIFIWGTTYISTKILLKSFTPIEILFVRFIIGYLALWIVYPHKLAFKNFFEELIFLLAGLSGITLYFLCENIALTFTLASNVGVIISIAPFFTALFSCIIMHDKIPSLRFFVGFVIAILGICLLSFSSQTELNINPLGDFLAAIAGIIWAIYSVLTKKISSFSYNTIQTTRRTFFYGIVFMIPALFFMDFHLHTSQFTNLENILNLLFLGFGASAVCFVTWAIAVNTLGTIKTSSYIYLVPVITSITSVIILNEEITFSAFIGIILTLLGLILSQSKNKITK